MIKYEGMLDHSGRIMICKMLREKIGATLNTPIEITVDNDSLIIKKSEIPVVCSLCQSDKNLKRIKSGFVCKECIERIKKCN